MHVIKCCHPSKPLRHQVRHPSELVPGTPPPFHVVGHLFFPSMGDVERAMAETTQDLIADQRNYFSVESIVEVNEVVAP
jgi:hypothetical protein